MNEKVALSTCEKSVTINSKLTYFVSLEREREKYGGRSEKSQSHPILILKVYFLFFLKKKNKKKKPFVRLN